jgi:hypothetical protein
VLASGTEAPEDLPPNEMADDGVLATALRDLGGKLSNRE